MTSTTDTLLPQQRGGGSFEPLRARLAGRLALPGEPGYER